MNEFLTFGGKILDTLRCPNAGARMWVLLVAIIVVPPGYASVFEDWITDHIKEKAGVVQLEARLEEISERLGKIDNTLAIGGQPCAVIPTSGHKVQSGRPGEWVRVDFKRLSRGRKGCGTPHIRAIVRNGDGVEHSTETSITGRPVPYGEFADISYQFRVPERAHPGYAALSISLKWPEASPAAASQIAPDVPFIILGPAMDLPSDQGAP